jgi:hypothetical protein
MTDIGGLPYGNRFNLSQRGRQALCGGSKVVKRSYLDRITTI